MKIDKRNQTNVLNGQIKWLTKFISDSNKTKIHYSQSTSWSRNNDEGFNDGIEIIVNQLKKRLSYLQTKKRKLQ